MQIIIIIFFFDSMMTGRCLVVKSWTDQEHAQEVLCGCMTDLMT